MKISIIAVHRSISLTVQIWNLGSFSFCSLFTWMMIALAHIKEWLQQLSEGALMKPPLLSLWNQIKSLSNSASIKWELTFQAPISIALLNCLHKLIQNLVSQLKYQQTKERKSQLTDLSNHSLESDVFVIYPILPLPRFSICKHINNI